MAHGKATYGIGTFIPAVARFDEFDETSVPAAATWRGHGPAMYRGQEWSREA